MRPYHGRVRIVKQRGGSIVVLACLLSAVTLTAMSHRSRSGLILPLLALSFGLATGCKTSVPQPPQAQTAGLRIDVQKVSSSARKQRIDVSLKIWNDHEQRISFDLAKRRLTLSLKDIGDRRLLLRLYPFIQIQKAPAHLFSQQLTNSGLAATHEPDQINAGGTL